MKQTAKLDTAKLKQSLTACARVATTRTTIPILAYVLVESGEGVRLRVTDLETHRSEWLPAATSGEWSAAVPLDALRKLLPRTATACKARPEIALEYLPGSVGDDTLRDDDRIRVTLGAATSTLRCLPAAEFPPCLESTTSEPCVLNGEVWADLSRKVLPAIAAEDARYLLCAARFELNGSARAIATDGHVLHKAEGSVAVTDPKIPEVETLIPRSVLFAASKDYAFREQKARVSNGAYKAGPRKGQPKTKIRRYWNRVHVSATDHHVMIETHSVRYVARITEGTFPDYERVIKKGTPECVITTTMADLSQAVRGVEHCTGDRARVIRLQTSGELPELHAANPDLGEATSTINGRTRMAGALVAARPVKPRKPRKATPYTQREYVLRLDAYENNVRAYEKKLEAYDPHDVNGLGVNPDFLLQLADVWEPDKEFELRLWDQNTQIVASGNGADCVIMPIRL